MISGPVLPRKVPKTKKLRAYKFTGPQDRVEERSHAEESSENEGEVLVRYVRQAAVYRFLAEREKSQISWSLVENLALSRSTNHHNRT